MVRQKPPRSGVLLELEMAAIRAALEQLERLPSDAFISVNVSPRRLVGTAPGCPREVDGSRVVLEISENAAADARRVQAKLSELSVPTGVRVALDDTDRGR